MPGGNDTPKRRQSKPSGPKPAKPTPDFPLFPHATGRWAKKIRGKLYYFGPWADPDGALAKYEEQQEALYSGRKPRDTTAEGIRLKSLCNQFLDAKQKQVDSGELTWRSWDDYRAACVLICKHFGNSRLVDDLGPDDFIALRARMAQQWGMTTLGNNIQRIRVVFKFAADNGLIERPVRYGQAFKRPSSKTRRLDRASKGPKLFTATEIRLLLGAASVAMQAMILLGINCGFGNSDCGHLPQSAVNLDAGMIDFPRPKTGIPRRCPLWPETVQALRNAIEARPTPRRAEHADLVFLTRFGGPWVTDTADQALAKEFGKLTRSLQIGRHGLGFYTLRHTFRTIADECRDQPAVDFLMGHESSHMSSVYRETISDARLRAATDHVRKWLFDTT